MIKCRISFHFKDGDYGLDCDFIVDLPDCVVVRGAEIGFDDFEKKIHGIIEAVRWWESSEEVEIEMELQENVVNLEELGKQLLDDERVFFVEYSYKDGSLWSEAR